MTDLTYTETLRVVHCWCGIAVAVPQNLNRRAQEDSNVGIYCPVGHKFFYTETTKEKLERAQEELRREQQRHRDTREWLRSEERSHAATRGHLTRVKKRVQHGVCPCCNRTFQNLQRHMTSKHPDYSAEAS